MATLLAPAPTSSGGSNNLASSNTSSNTLPDVLPSASGSAPLAVSTAVPGPTPNTPQPISGTTQKGGFLSNVLSSVFTPVARLATNVINAGQTALGKPTTQPFSNKSIGMVNFGNVTPVGQENSSGAAIKDDLGTGLQIGSNLVGGEGAADIAEQSGKQLLKQSVIQGAKTGAVAGGTQALGSSLSANEGIGKTALNTIGGVVAGGTTGGVFGTVTGGLGAAKNLISPTEDAVNKAKASIADQYEKTLPLTPTQKAKEASLLANKEDNVYTTLANNGINLGSDQAPKQLQDLSDQYANATQHAQINEHSFFNVDEIKANAFDQINQRISSETARQTAKNTVETEIDALIKANPKSVTTGQNGERMINSDLVERLRRTGNEMTPFNASDPQKIGQSTGYAISNAVRDQVDKQGTFPAYREANSEWGKIIHAQQILGDIDNKGKPFKVPGGLSGAIARRVLSGAIGFHTAGVGGAILGEMGSEYGAKIMANPELRTYIERQTIDNFNNGQKITPEVITRLKQQVDDYLSKQSSMPQLEAPQSIPLGESTPKMTPPNKIGNDIQQNSRILQNTRQLPAPRTNEIAIPLNAESPKPQGGAQVLQASKNPVSVNPQNNRFQTTFNSGGSPLKK